MVQTVQDGGYEGLQDFLLPDAAQEPERDSPQVLVGVLQVVAQVLADQDLQRNKQTGSQPTRLCTVAGSAASLRSHATHHLRQDFAG